VTSSPQERLGKARRNAEAEIKQKRRKLETKRKQAINKRLEQKLPRKPHLTSNRRDLTINAFQNQDKAKLNQQADHKISPTELELNIIKESSQLNKVSNNNKILKGSI